MKQCTTKERMEKMTAYADMMTRIYYMTQKVEYANRVLEIIGSSADVHDLIMQSVEQRLAGKFHGDANERRGLEKIGREIRDLFIDYERNTD